MKLIEWYLDVDRGTLKVDDNATTSEEWEEKTKYCGNCKHYSEFEGVCTNGDSEYRADFTDFDDMCGEWEENKE